MSTPTKRQHPGQLIVQWQIERELLCKECPLTAKCKRPTLLGGATIETAMEAYLAKTMCFNAWLNTRTGKRVAVGKQVYSFAEFKSACPHLKQYYLKQYNPNMLISELDSVGVSDHTIRILLRMGLGTVDALLAVDIKKFGGVKDCGLKTMRELKFLKKELNIWKNVKWTY